MADSPDTKAALQDVAGGETLPAAGTPTPAFGGSAGRRGPLSYQDGDLVAERYRIVRAIGEGGMGEVYEAEDLLLKERVALKTLRDPIAGDETSVLRFKREIQLARRVTHPNVCRIFDVGLDRRAGRENAFLTMELLAGETLAARIKRGGRLPHEETLAVAEQVASALGAAHAAGVIHRDLKCANVVLVDGDGTARAVVTDFGLARATAEGADQVTGDGGIVGSPAYMAPEQVEGGRGLTSACDIYALGVVLFEMATGRLPFVGDTPLATAVMRLREPPPSPRELVPDLDAFWERTILACLARKPEDRPASALDVVRGLRGEVAPPPRRTAPSTGVSTAARRRRLLLAGLAVLGLVVGAGLLVRARRGDPERATWPRPMPPAVPPLPPRPPKPPIPPTIVHAGPDEALIVVPARASARRGVAIMGFKNLGGQKAFEYVSTALAEMLSTELSASPDLRVIPGESVARGRRQLSLGAAADTYAGDTLDRLRLTLDADIVISGSYLVSSDGERVRVDLRVQDTRSHDTVSSVSESGDLDELADLVTSAGEALRDQLHADEPSASEREGVRASLPRKTDVARLYSEGLAQMHVDNCGAARGPLEQAVAADPSFALAHEALSEVLYCLGYEGRALEEAKRAVELSSGLPQDTRLLTEARLRVLDGQAKKAETIYADLFKRHPDNYDYGLRLLRLQSYLAPEEARRTLAQLRRLAPATATAELDMFDVRLQEKGSPEERLAALEKARARAEEQGARLVAAAVLREEAQLELATGSIKQALEAARRAKEVFQASGDKDGIILSLSDEAAVAHRRGDEEGVKRALAQATALAEQIDSVRSLVSFYIRLAEMDMHDGDLAGAQEEFETGLRIVKHARPHELGRAIKVVALLYFYQGEPRKVDKALGQAMESFSEIGDTMGLAGARFALAQMALVEGRPEDARRLAQQAMATDDAIARANASGLIEAWAQLSAGHPGAAETLLRKMEGIDEARSWTLPFLSERIRFDCQLAQGKVSDARATLARIAARAGKAPAFADKLMMDTFAARLKAASDKRDGRAAAIADLEAVSARAAKAGFVYHRLLADLARGRLERADGRAGAARATLNAVARDAGRRHLGHIAEQAATELEEMAAGK